MSVRATIVAGDCVQKMAKQEPGIVQLMVADPPYNIGRDYDVYNDKRTLKQYMDFTFEWGYEAKRLLDDHGSLWVAIYPNLVSEIDVLFKQQLGFCKRGHIIWAFSFGQNGTKNFTRSHTHWLYYTKAKTKFTFNALDPQLRIPSMRTLKYHDKRANPNGRLPNDVWILDLEQLGHELPKDLDVWIESRVNGTFNERVKGSDNQLPLAITNRIIRACSNPGDLVCDPFGGTFTTGVSAVQLGRNFLGFELSKDYARAGKARIEAAVRAMGDIGSTGK